MKAPQKVTKFKEFESLSGEDIYMATTNGGHTASVGEEPTPLHPLFHAFAMSKGAVPAGQRQAYLAEKAMNDTANNVEKTNDDVILDAVVAVMTEAMGDAGRATVLLTSDGRPDVKAVSDRAGFKVTATQRDAAWDLYQAEVS